MNGLQYPLGGERYLFYRTMESGKILKYVGQPIKLMKEKEKDFDAALNLVCPLCMEQVMLSIRQKISRVLVCLVRKIERAADKWRTSRRISVTMNEAVADTGELKEGYFEDYDGYYRIRAFWGNK